MSVSLLLAPSMWERVASTHSDVATAMFALAPFCSSVVLPIVAGATAFGAGAQVEVVGGQSPRTGVSEGEPAFYGGFRAALGARLQERLSTTTLRYTPRLLYRPGTFDPERPLVLHQLAFTRQDSLSRRVRVQVGAASVLGELQPGRGAQEELGTSNTRLDTSSISVFTGSANTALQYRLSRISALTTGLAGAYRTSSSLPVLPGMSVREGAVPESMQGTLSFGYQRRLSRRLELSAPLELGYYWSEQAGTFTVLGLGSGLDISLNRRTQVVGGAGATFVRASSDAAATPAVFPSADVSVSSTLYRKGGDSTRASISVRHSGEFDALQGQYRPYLSADASVAWARPPWTTSASLGVAVVTTSTLNDNAARSSFRADVPVGYRLDDNLQLTFGFRGAAYSEEWPNGPVAPRQVEALGFVAVRGAFATGNDAQWVF
jgi:hypothetical protein